jgi:phosphoribosylformylglycinamidine synthase
VTAAHDVSDGGAACALAECAIAGEVGIKADLDPLVELRGLSGETCLFGEGPGGFVVSGGAAGLDELSALADARGIATLRIGAAAGSRVEIAAAEIELSLALADCRQAWTSLGSG